MIREEGEATPCLSYICPRCGVDYLHHERLGFHERFEPEECEVMRELRGDPEPWALLDVWGPGRPPEYYRETE